MRLFDPFLYEKVHELIIFAFTLFYCLILRRKQAINLITRRQTKPAIFIYALLYIIVIGLRPISAPFGDTMVYAKGYSDFSAMSEMGSFRRDSLFYKFMWVCSHFISVHWFFVIIEVFYILPIIISCKRLLKKNADIGLLFCFTAFSFFSYSVNGIRNGMALSLVLLAITFIRGDNLEKIICGILSLLAIAIHTSAALPVVCMLAANFIKNPKVIFFFWGLSIIVSIVGGNAVANLFAGLGFDDRLSDYIHPEIEEDIYTVTGFRWDFLLYSAMPILLGWYLVFKKSVYNSTYLLLLGSYVLANAFWIMVIRAEFSNRFAYLSWFLYPIVLAYPLLKLKIWPKTQGRKTAVIMMAHLAFTLFMVFIIGS